MKLWCFVLHFLHLSIPKHSHASELPSRDSKQVVSATCSTCWSRSPSRGGGRTDILAVCLKRPASVRQPWTDHAKGGRKGKIRDFWSIPSCKIWLVKYLRYSSIPQWSPSSNKNIEDVACKFDRVAMCQLLSTQLHERYMGLNDGFFFLYVDSTACKGPGPKLKVLCDQAWN